MKEIQFSPSKIMRCVSLIKDTEEEFEIIFNQTNAFKLKKFEAILLSNLIYRIISTDLTCSSYKLQYSADDEIITSFFTQISSTNLDIPLEKVDYYLPIAKELEMPEVIEAIKFNSALIPTQNLELPLIFYDYKSLLQSIAKNINKIPEKWLLSIPTSFIIDIYNQNPEFDDWNVYVNTIISHHLPVHYLNDVPISDLEISTMEMLIKYYIEMNSQQRIAEVALALAKIAQDLQIENTELQDIIKNGVKYDKENDCSFIKSGRTYIREEFWKCIDCCHNNQIICTACKNKCHAGHSVVPYQTLDGFCDCGAGDLGCKCQCMDRKHLIK